MRGARRDGTFTHRYGFSGLALDRAAVRSWLEGDGLYAYRDPISHLGAALPPAAAFLLAPASSCRSAWPAG